MNDDLHSILRKIAENQRSPYKNVKLIGDKLIVVLSDGQIVTKDGATEEDYYAVVEAKTKTEIRNKISVENNDVEKVEFSDMTGTYTTNYNMKKSIKNRINKIN